MTRAAAARRPAALRVIELPADATAAPERVFAEPDFVWHGRDGRALAAAGEAWRIDATGPERLAEVQAAAADLWAGVAGEAPPLVGGFAFAPGFSDELWRGFADASFVLPRWTWLREGARARLFGVFADGDAPPEPPRAGVIAALPAVRAVDPGAASEFEALVDDILALIRDGAARKIVAARRTAVELDGAASPVAVLERLGAAGGDTTRFLVRRGAAAFVGATPERLISRDGLAILCEALAGTCVPGGALLESAKDRGEHAFVVREIVRALAPRCDRLVVPDEPETRALRHVVHLRTPIAGQLAAPAHLLELAAALHPTPAVAGVPTARAVEVIRAREPARGWYTGAVGWFDRDGDGDLVVALRAGLLAGRHAHTWSGGGIVAGSRPEAEWAETGWKQRAFLAALGAHGA